MKRSIVAALGLAAILVAAPAARGDGPPGVAPAEPARSIHRIEHDLWQARAATGWAPPRGPEIVSPAPPRASGPLVREVHGYHPWWMGSAYVGYDWSLLSTVAFFSLDLDGTGAVVDDHGWPWTTLVSTAHAHGVRVLVTATLFSTSEIDALLADPARRQVAITNLVSAVQSAGADGVNVDFEGVPGSRKQDLVTFVGELQAALQSALPQPYLSLATPAVDWSNAFDYDELAARCDHLMVMAYDYFWAGSAFSGPVAPLAGWGAHNVSWTVQDYQTWGASPSKMLLGVPYFGYRWGTVSGEPGALTTSSGVARTYVQARVEADTHGALWDAESSTPWYRYQDPDWNQGWFDDATSLPLKYDLVENEGLAGVGIWALGYDGTRTELWDALDDAFTDPTDVTAGGPESARPLLALAGPNPFRDGTRFRVSLPGPSPASLTIHDVAGRFVRRVWRGAGGEDRLVAWDGTTEGGGPAVPGTYFVRLQSDEAGSSLRVVRLR